MNTGKVLQSVKKKTPALVQILLLFKFSITNSPIYVFLVVFPKYIPILSLADNFSLELTSEYKNNYLLSNIYRKMSCFFFIKLLNSFWFYFLSSLFFILHIIFICYLLSYFIKIKTNKKDLLVLGIYPKFFFYLLSLFSHYLLEFYSYSILFCFKKKFQLPTNEVFKTYSNIKILQYDEMHNQIAIWAFSSINFLSYVLVNMYLVFIFCVINAPYNSNDKTLNFSNFKLFSLLIIVTNFASVHYIFIFVSFYKLLFYFLLGIIFAIFFASFIYVFVYYEKINNFYSSFLSIQNYIFLSIIFCFISDLKKFTYTKEEIIVIFFIKIFFTYFFTKFISLHQKNTILVIMKTVLFEDYQSNKKKCCLSMYRFLIDLLISMKEAKNQKKKSVLQTDISEVIISHIQKCENDHCKCKIMQIIPSNIFTSPSNFDFGFWFSSSIGFLFEPIIGSINPFANPQYIILIGDYFFYVKENPLLAYGFIDSAISAYCSSKRSVPFHVLSDLYGLRNSYSKCIQEAMVNCKKAVSFKKIFNSIHQRTEFYKSIIHFSEIYNYFVDSKANFENTLKINYDGNEVKKVQCDWLKKPNVREMLLKFKDFYYTFTSINFKVKTFDSSISSIEFYYIINLFFHIFTSQIPRVIIEKLQKTEIGDMLKGVDQSEVIEIFSEYLDNYFSNDYSSNQMIIKFSKGIKIKFISSNLCNKLGYEQITLKGDDFHSLFPKELREAHTKAMLHYMMYEKNFFFHGSTFIFTKSLNILPCKIKAACLPQLGKVLMMIMEIKIVKEDQKLMMLDENLNGISLSKKVEDEFLLSLKILSKCETDLRDIFEFHQRLIANNFSDTFSLISKIQKELKLNAVDKLSRLIFSSQRNFDRGGPGIIINKNSLNVNNANQFLFDTSLLKDKKKRKKFYFSKNPDIIIHNIIRAFNKINDNTLKETQFDKLNKVLPVFNLATSFLDKNKLQGLHIKNVKSRSRRKSFFNEVSMSSSPKRFLMKELNFKVTMRLCYNFPLFIMKIKDCGENEDDIPKNSRVPSNNRISIRLLSIHQKKKETQIIEKKEGTLGARKESKGSKPFCEKAVKEFYLRHRANKTKRLYFLIVLVSAVLTVFVVLIIYSNVRRINNSQVILNYFFSLLYHRDKLYYLESFVLSLSFQFGEYSKMRFTEDEMMNELNKLSSEQGNSITFLYNKMISYTKRNPKNVNPITFMQNINFTKVIKDWEPIYFQSNYIEEINYVTYVTKLAVLEDKKEDIVKDIDNAFLHRLILDRTVPVYSNFGAAFYFILTNINSSIGAVLQKIGLDIEIVLDKFISKDSISLFSFQCSWIVFNYFLSSLFFIMVYKFNRRIYKVIISMFFYGGVDANSEKVNKRENYFIKQKISTFIKLIQNFNDENRAKFDNCKPESDTKAESSGNLPTNQNDDNLPSHSTTNTNTNIMSSSVSNTQTASTNNILNLNSTNNLKSTKSLRLLSLSTNKKGPVGSHFLSNQKRMDGNIVFKVLKKEGKIKNISIISMILVIGYVILISGVFCLMIENTISFQKFLKNSRKILLGFTSYIYYVCNYFNVYKLYVVRRQEIPQRVLNLLYNATASEAELSEIIDIDYMSNYKNLKDFWKIINRPYDESITSEFYLLCSQEESCVKVISEPNSYCSQSVTLGYKLIMQKYFELSNGFNTFIKTNPLFNKEELVEFLESKDFSTVQENVDFVFLHIQTSLYKIFFIDYEQIKINLRGKTLILFSIGFGLCSIYLFFLLFVLVEELKRLAFISYFSGVLFNQSFFKNVFEDKVK